MTTGSGTGAGRGQRPSPRRVALATAASGLVLALALAACDGSWGSAGGSSDGSSSAGNGDPAAASAAGSSGGSGDPAAASADSGPGTALGPDGAALPDRIGDVALDVMTVEVPEALEGTGGPELTAMLAALDLAPSAVSLVIAVDPIGRLAIGRWSLPGRGATAILDAWERAGGSGWRSTVLGGEPALAGAGPDGSSAWAVARDGVLVYVVTDDAGVAQAAVASTR